MSGHYASRGGVTNNLEKCDDLMTALVVILPIMKTYIDSYMTVTMTVMEMYASMTVVHHNHQNMIFDDIMGNGYKMAENINI